MINFDGRFLKSSGQLFSPYGAQEYGVRVINMGWSSVVSLGIKMDVKSFTPSLTGM